MPYVGLVDLSRTVFFWARIPTFESPLYAETPSKIKYTRATVCKLQMVRGEVCLHIVVLARVIGHHHLRQLYAHVLIDTARLYDVNQLLVLLSKIITSSYHSLLNAI
jgi:hypothetical protein